MVVPYDEEDVSFRLAEEYIRGFNDGILHTKEALKTPNCWNCKWASFFEDSSVGIPLTLDDCNCPNVPTSFIEEFDEKWENKFGWGKQGKEEYMPIEEYFPKYCFNFELNWEQLKLYF
jgi:hypothetical protein